MADAYVNQLLADGATNLWTLGDASGPAASNSVGGGVTAAYGGTFSLQAPGVLPDFTSCLFTSGYCQTASDPFANPAAFSVSILLRVQTLADCYVLTDANGSTGNNQRFYLDTRLSDAAPDFAVLSAANVAHDAIGIPTLANNVWHQVVGTWDGTNVRTYLDGAFGGIAACGVFFNPGSCLMSIGGWQQRTAGSISRFVGYMSCCATYNRQLSDVEISNQFQKLGQVAVLPVGQPPTSGQIAANTALLERILADVERTY